MIVLIPLGGLGTRFKKYGYRLPKPLIKVMGKPIIYWLLDNLNLENINLVLIPYNSELAIYRFEDMLKKDYNGINFKFHKLNNNTNGASETVLMALKNLVDHDPNLDDMPVLCLDGDNFYTQDILDEWNGDNCVFTFRDTSEEPVYSYLNLDEDRILDIVEKEKISHYASTGGYGFDSWKKLIEYCQKVVEQDITQKGEYYLSNVVKEMIKDNYIFKPKYVDGDNFTCLGTPLHVRLFCNSLKGRFMVEPKRVCFDLDNTLVTFPKKAGDYSTAEPIEKNINFLRFLKKIGNTIIIYTARRMKTHMGNQGKVVADIAEETFKTLNKFDIPYDEIYFGKPYAHFYIDDLCISPFDDLEKEVGFYNSNISTRYFNSISPSNIETLIKSSDDLSGEIYYYKNIPTEVKDLFPLVINFGTDDTWYEMEKVDGIPFSKLYLAEELTINQIDVMFDSIKRIHNCHIDQNSIDKKLDIYSNYAKKLKMRFDNYDYSRFENYEEIFSNIFEGLTVYELKEQGKLSVIHGDPVFTNIIINLFRKLKFIDMRGKLGNINTIYGDQFYDWAKIYQSLIGYDEILGDQIINKEYKTEIINHFQNRFIELYDETKFNYVKLITKSLLFTLIPLHDNNKCTEYYKLINSPYLN